MPSTSSHPAAVRGCAIGSNRRLALRVERAKPHSLVVSFDDRRTLPDSGMKFDRLTLSCGGHEVHLGPCQFEQRSTQAHRRKDDPAVDSGDGRMVFLERVYDFRQLLRTGRVVDLSQKVEQLPMVWNRKFSIKASFRELVSQLLFDLQVYRALFDDLDRNLESEPFTSRDQVQRIAVHAEYGAFCRFFDRHLAELEAETRRYSKQQSEQHGFFFRKQLWDIILSSEFLARTNLKPRGYAGDSEMMRMIYENDFRGDTVFAKFMHRHPIETAAAEAVRNRCTLLAEAITNAAGRRRNGRRAGPARVMSLACGPAWELRNVFHDADDVQRYEFVLVDQDPLALNEASSTLGMIQAGYGTTVRARLIRESARTMLQRADLAKDWGQFQLIYSMGLFDYLTKPVARAVITKLYELLAPGGELILGNFHPKHPTRTYMEYWMDWVLYYRNEEELLELAEGLPKSDVSLVFEATGSQMFMRVVKA